MIYIEILLVAGTWALVWVTFRMARQQAAILREQSDAVRADLRVRLQLTFIDRFDGERMIEARKDLARLLLSKAPHDQIEETVMDFFEDAGLFLRRGYLDEELVWSTFGFYGVLWWTACRNYILEERKQKNDPTLFEDFEILANNLTRRDAKRGLVSSSPIKLEEFLEEERDL